MLFGHSWVNLAALRVVKLCPALLIWLFRKPCTIRRSGGLVSACKSTPASRRLSAWATRGPLLTANCQRHSARSFHTEFTTGLTAFPRSVSWSLQRQERKSCAAKGVRRRNDRFPGASPATHPASPTSITLCFL